MGRSKWVLTSERLPERQDVMKSRRRYMVYSPIYGGFLFKCWFNDGWGAVEPESMVSDVICYRVANQSEKDGQASRDDVIAIEELTGVKI